VYIKKNKYDSILDVMTRSRIRFDIDDFLRNYNNFEDVDNVIRCECGTVEAYRVEAGIFYGCDGYIIFPFPTDDEEIGRMYYFELV
jgi:hypothetical protein